MSHTVPTENPLEVTEQAEQRVAGASCEGERLDEARAEFRAVWAAKVSRKRRQAAWARVRAAALHRLSREIQIAGLLLGAIAGPILLPGVHGFLDLAKVIVAGALLGAVLVLPLLFLTQGSAGANRQKAEHLESAARTLERQVDCGEAGVALAGSSTAKSVLPEAGAGSFDEARAKFRAEWSADLASKSEHL